MKQAHCIRKGDIIDGHTVAKSYDNTVHVDCDGTHYREVRFTDGSSASFPTGALISEGTKLYTVRSAGKGANIVLRHLTLEGALKAVSNLERAGYKAERM